MNKFKGMIIAAMLTSSLFGIESTAFAGEKWQELTFPPPNPGHLVFAIAKGGNPECASYDGKSCLWGQSIGDIDFTRVTPLVCGAGHRELYGVTGFEDPNHWCNLALKKAR